ncbi:MAG: phage major capsid protein [Hyphomicrobiaceae bacterium]
MTTTFAPETKSSADLGFALDDLLRAFETYKEENDRRIAEVETRGAVDPLTIDKLDRLDRALDDHKRRIDEMTLKAARPPLGSGAPRSHVAREHKAAFDGYIRKGEATGLLDLEGKALSVGSGPDGGYLVPVETEQSVNMTLKEISPIRAIASIRQVSSSVYKKPFSTVGAGAGWVGGAAERPETTTPTLAELSFPTTELYAMPAATGALLDDAAVDIDQWIAEEVRSAFAEQEGTAFVVGTGTNMPTGFMYYDKIANASWEWGKIGSIKTGVDAAFPSTNPGDKLIDFVYTIKAGYRANARFVMNRATQAVIRKMKDEDGHYLWHPAVSPGESPSLMGFPVTESEDMPDIAADAYAIAFGDFRRGYLIVDRVGIRILRDPYSSKPYVLFYTTKRVGGGVQDFDAIKLLQFGD